MPIAGKVPLGYSLNKVTKKWDVDEEAAQTTRKIFQLRLKGNSINRISNFLMENKILSPAAYKYKKSLQKSPEKNLKITINDYVWNETSITRMLQNRTYTGDVINFKTFSISYKIKKRFKNSTENIVIHKNGHEPIIEREAFEIVQKSFETKYKPNVRNHKNMFVGLLKCKSCNSNLFSNFQRGNYYLKCEKYNRSRKLFSDNCCENSV